jgi:hypothetical protein
MTERKKIIQDPDLAKVEDALKRAAQTARKIAKDTGTPLVIYENGQIVLEKVEKENHLAVNE